jgi:hypothetical protein
MSNKLSKQEIAEVVEGYKRGYSAYKLAKKYNISTTSIYGLLKRRDISRRTYSEAGRVYTLNEKYFDNIDDENKAYYLGLLMADGYNNEKRGAVTLILSKRDLHILKRFNDDISSNKPVAIVNNKNGTITGRLEFCSRYLSCRLAQIGCMQNKTFKITFPFNYIQEDLYRHFIRGYFDGDGCFSYTEARRNNYFGNSLLPVITIVGTADICESIKKILSQVLDISSNISRRKKDSTNNIMTLRITGTNQIIKYMEWMYGGSEIYLERKRRKFNSFIDKLNNRKAIVHQLRSNNGSIQVDKINKTSNFIKLSDIVKSPIERWNARYLMSINKIETVKDSIFTSEQAKILRDELDRYGENLAIPEKDIEACFSQARSWGFPYYEFTKERFKKGIHSLKKANICKSNNMYNWAGNGSELASFFHPHMFECKSKGKMSALEFFNSDEDFTRGIWKLIALYGKITKSNIREICRNEKASSRINQFPPKVAMAVLKELYPDGGIKYLDPTHGFSGRLIGAYCSGLVNEYIGVDLSKDTHLGAEKTKKWIESSRENSLFDDDNSNLSSTMDIKLIEGDCLEVMSNLDKDFDLIFTSPPFLDVEQYKGVPFKTDYKQWLDVFIKPFIDRSFECLAKGGKMAVYLEKIGGRDFRGDFTKIATQRDFKQNDSIMFKMSYGENNRDKATTRGTPILVFTK